MHSHEILRWRLYRADFKSIGFLSHEERSKIGQRIARISAFLIKVPICHSDRILTLIEAAVTENLRPLARDCVYSRMLYARL
jgi:hypothetical protein